MDYNLKAGSIGDNLMPIYPTSFFIPPQGVPFIVEDKYVRGGYRVLATIAERDAIATASRKEGMLVRCQDDGNIWELKGGTTNTFWKLFDPTKYIKLGAPLIIDGTGNITLDLSSQFSTDGTGKLIIDMTNFLGPSLVTALSAVAGDNGKVVYYDHPTTSFKLKTVSAGTTYTGTNPITVSGSTISLNITTLMSTALVNHYSAVAGDNGKILAYDHPTTSFKLITAPATGTALARTTGTNSPGVTAAAAVKDFTMPTGKTSMLLELSLNVPDVTIECHSTAARNDLNPYKFKSSSGKLFDDGISVLEDSSLQYNRRYAFIANLETPTVGIVSYWRVTNNAATSQTITVNMTYMKFE